MSEEMNFDAMYFPYVAINEEEAIIRGILLFNKVNILAPKTKTVEERIRPYKDYDSPYISELEPVWFAGRSHRENLRILCESIDRDMENPHFRQIVKRVEARDYSYIHIMKFPSYILKKYQNRFIGLSRNLKREINYLDVEDNDEYTKYNLSYLADEWLLTRSDLAYSLMLNYTIMSMRTRQYSPFTDSEKHAFVLESMLKNELDFSQQYQRDAKKGFLELLVPTLNGISIEEANLIRKNNEKLFSNFHINMARLFKIRRNEFLQKGVDETSEEIYYSDVEPKLKELKIMYVNTRERLLAEIGGAILVGVATLTVLPLIPVTAATAAASGGIAIKQKLALREAKRNNFATYIYKIREEINKKNQKNIVPDFSTLSSERHTTKKQKIWRIPRFLKRES